MFELLEELQDDDTYRAIRDCKFEPMEEALSSMFFQMAIDLAALPKGAWPIQADYLAKAQKKLGRKKR